MFALSGFAGASFAVGYFNAVNKLNPKSFYQKNLHVWGRVIFGFAIGGWLGYQRFGDRQRLHNAYTADRLYRRYPDCKSLSAGNLESLRGEKANHEFYRWA